MFNAKLFLVSKISDGLFIETYSPEQFQIPEFLPIKGHNSVGILRNKNQ